MYSASYGVAPVACGTIARSADYPLAEHTTANEVETALRNISHTLSFLRAIGADTEGVMKYADHVIDGWSR